VKKLFTPFEDLPLQDVYFSGTITSQQAGGWQVKYDDGQTEDDVSESKLERCSGVHLLTRPPTFNLPIPSCSLLFLTSPQEHLSDSFMT
jgi:hypothetical protein